MRFDRITSSYSNVIRRLPQQKDRIRIVPLEVMVTSLLAGFYVTSLLSNAYRILEAMSPILHGFLLQQVSSTSPAMMESRPCSPRPVQKRRESFSLNFKAAPQTGEIRTGIPWNHREPLCQTISIRLIDRLNLLRRFRRLN
jgi:hypothetical protein